MYCENCGKKLIRGYQFCMECGTPVPPEVEEEEENEYAQANEQSASEQPSGEMPGIQPIGNEEGTLVFCPTCGMRMQKSTDHCEKCGMKLNANGSSGVPLVNTDPLGGEFGGISDSDLARIDNFVNNSGLGGDISYDVSGGSDDMGGLGGGLGGIGGLGGGDLNSEIEALNQQFANLNATSSDMPAISAPAPEPEPQPEPVPQEPDLGTLSRRIEDFSMEAGMPETQFLSESGLPVINGGEMAEPDEPMQLEQNYDDINIDITAPAPTAVAEPEAPAYTEPEAPAYTEPEAPAYTEPEAPAYTEPEAPAYTEPEAPAYTEPEAPAYAEPEAPAYAEPEAPAYTEPEAPAYTEPEAPHTPSRKPPRTPSRKLLHTLNQNSHSPAALNRSLRLPLKALRMTELISASLFTAATAVRICTRRKPSARTAALRINGTSSRSRRMFPVQRQRARSSRLSCSAYSRYRRSSEPLWLSSELSR